MLGIAVPMIIKVKAEGASLAFVTTMNKHFKIF